MNLLVPVYDRSLVGATCAAAKAGGHVVAIANPDSGPGQGSAVPGWKADIKALRKSGAQVLYYVDLKDDSGKEKSETTLKSEMDSYVSWYGASVGWFFDDLDTYTTTRATRLQHLVAYKGGFTVANPGAGVSQDYLNTGVNVLITWETNGYRQSQPLPWELANPSRVGAMALGEPSFAPPLALAKQRNISLFYATNAPDGSAVYDQLPPYFSKMAAAV